VPRRRAGYRHVRACWHGPGYRSWWSRIPRVLSWGASGQPISYRLAYHDNRILFWDHEARTVSIWVSDLGDGKPGRLRGLAFTGRDEDVTAVVEFRQGETDLVYRDGGLYPIPTLEMPDPDAYEPEGWLGVDPGIVNIAYTSAGENWSGGKITHQRKKNRRIGRTAQARGTRSAKRLLTVRRHREGRFATNTNHIISKRIVAAAKAHRHGIAPEALWGIRERARHRKPQPATRHSWAFRQLGEFIALPSPSRRSSRGLG